MSNTDVPENPPDDKLPKETEGLSRRSLLKRGLFGGLILGMGGVFAYQQSGYELKKEKAEALKILGAKEFIVLQAIAARVLASDEDGAPEANEVGVVEWIDGYLHRQSSWVQKDFLMLLNAIEHAGPVMDFQFSRFTRMSAKQQDKVLGNWARSRLGLRKQGFSALKGLCVMAYYRHPKTWDMLGYDGPLVKKQSGGK
ncbi:MAG: gluconate 2-dehydrogenase subunit 3 family protein [Planctomycetota bacterium]|nr:gluconate 2-dehydrogenase subunit 3 family protein [Planctomycetota bacterium]